MIHVVIPSKNPPISFYQTLEKLSEQETEMELEVSIIDSGSSEEQLGLIRSLCSKFNFDLVEIRPEDFSHSGTRNIGALRKKSKVTLFLTQDAMPIDDNWAETLAQPFIDADVVGAFGLHKAWPDHSKSTAQHLQEHFHRFESWDKNETGEHYFNPNNHFFSNNNSAVRTDFFKSLHFPNVEFGEDQSWSKAAKQAGKKIVYVPKAAVYHSHEYSLLDRLRRSIDEGNHLSSQNQNKVIANPIKHYSKAFFKRGGLLREENRLSLFSTLGYQLGSGPLGPLLVKFAAFSYDKRLRDGKRGG